MYELNNATANVNAEEPNGSCKNCGKKEYKYSWKVFKCGTAHIQANCAICGSYKQWCRQKTDVNEPGRKFKVL